MPVRLGPLRENSLVPVLAVEGGDLFLAQRSEPDWHLENAENSTVELG